MINIQGPGSLKKMSGRFNGEVCRIPDLLFARKHLTHPKESRNIKNTKHLFSFVSSPQIYKDKIVIGKTKGWCHALREPDKLLTKVPKIFLPESDFMDPGFIAFRPREKHKQYDFFYYTLNSRAGINNKGLKVFCDCISILCNDMKLKGLVIVYFPNVPRRKFLSNLDSNDRRRIENSNLTFVWGKLNDSQMAKIASQSKFGFFPNTVDNSPRTISEAMIRDVPILVNEEIHGGWHYVNEQTGQLFNKKNLAQKVSLIMKNQYSPRDYFIKNYGFERSSRKLAEFIQSIVTLDKKYSHIYFKNYEKFMREMIL